MSATRFESDLLEIALVTKWHLTVFQTDLSVVLCSELYVPLFNGIVHKI